MARPDLRVDWRICSEQTGLLQSLVHSTIVLSPKHRKLVAEIALLRLFILLENTIESAASKVLCGAAYLDGSTPNRLVQPTSKAAALAAMQSHGRTKTVPFLRWSKARDVRKNLRLTLAPHDSFHAVMLRHAPLLGEMRRVRNHIAHANAGTRSEFRKVIRAHYGGLKRGMTPGLFLLTGALGPPCVLEKYLVSVRVFAKDLLHA